MKKHDGIIITDFTGNLFSFSVYTLEEVVARNYLIQERPNAILNIGRYKPGEEFVFDYAIDRAGNPGSGSC